ncbi:MAG: hypothetical protein SF053_17815 [Bacteroidia bacterium]|nr:hypothetical protein [Bacteroidia bacterium]
MTSSHISIAQLQAALLDTAVALQAAAGNDAFISQDDLEKLLLSVYGARETERGHVIASLYNMAQLTESPGGRITRKDIDRAVQLTLEQILPELRLEPGGLSAPAEFALNLLGIDYSIMARNLKSYAHWLQARPAAELVTHLRPLVHNLYFNTFHQQDTSIQVGFAPFGHYPAISAATFVMALEQSGDPAWEQASQLLGTANEQPGTLTAFWREFPTLQNEGVDQARALAVERLWRMHLSPSRLLRFDHSVYETTHFVVAGLNGNHEMVYMLLRHLWS